MDQQKNDDIDLQLMYDKF
jgi:hypothetical protein